jgi:hypothetical protein
VLVCELSFWWIGLEVGRFSLLGADSARWLALGVGLEKSSSLRLRGLILGPETPA